MKTPAIAALVAAGLASAQTGAGPSMGNPDPFRLNRRSTHTGSADRSLPESAAHWPAMLLIGGVLGAAGLLTARRAAPAAGPQSGRPHVPARSTRAAGSAVSSCRGLQ